MQKPKSVKYKVITGYLLLFAIAVISVWFVYTEILKIATPSHIRNDNKEIISISNAIADLYASEAVGRTSILTGAPADYEKYSLLIDSISADIGAIKEDVEESQVQKFDSIQLLLEKKRTSISEIIRFRKTYTQESAFRKAIDKFQDVKDSIVSRAKPVEQYTEKNRYRELLNQLLTPRQLDSLSKFASNDSLTIAFADVLNDYFVKDNQVQYQLYRKEQSLLEENRVISDQLRVILASVENEFLRKSYAKINESQAAFSKTAETMAYVGAVTFFLLLIFAWIIIRDLTSNQNYRQQLEVLNNENEELLRSKSMLMATVTHDLQTPLGSIIGFYDLIKNSTINPKQKQYLNNIKESADYILKLVNDLLDFSKLENNRISIHKTGFNMKSLIENTCKTLEPIALNKNIELNWDIEDTLDSTFLSDPYRIKQVITNLISNALKFTSEGSVEVTGKIEDNRIYISVIDTGIGIATEKHADVFREFTQAHSGIEKKFGGTGLGLTISKKIIELLDGDITLESEEGQGSIFTITLPCEPCEAAPEETKSQIANSFDALQNKKILIVDDDAVQLTLMKEMFASIRVHITTEINAANVVQLLEAEKFDTVLTDIQMPVTDGFELIKMIRNHNNDTIASIPVIALSGKRDLAARDFTDAGFTASHPKPVQFEQLLDLLSALFTSGKAISSSPEASITTAADDSPLFNLRSLAQFTYNDAESLKTILITFIQSARDNCKVLQTASKTGDDIKIAETAHKMIPMLKQMEVYSIAELLIPLEDGDLEMSPEEKQVYIDNICTKMAELCVMLTKEFA